NPFLPNFYRDRERYAFQTEMFFLLSRFRQQETFAQEELFARFTISDYLFVKCRLFAHMTLNEHERALFDKVYAILTRGIPTPDLVVYLYAPVAVLMERIQRRGRAYERQVDRDYMEQLLTVYNEHFSTYTETPLLTVDTTHINFQDEGAVAELLTEMSAALRTGRRSMSGLEAGPVQGLLS
ncbi:MAG: deoxynucleoside kinase, partial [Myxococcota bacterium]